MSVYVDNINLPFRGGIYCHMVADSTDELDEMADKIGLKRSWIQNPGTIFEHYDVSLFKKQLALDEGAIEISVKKFVSRIESKRKLKNNNQGKSETK